MVIAVFRISMDSTGIYLMIGYRSEIVTLFSVLLPPNGYQLPVVSWAPYVVRRTNHYDKEYIIISLLQHM